MTTGYQPVADPTVTPYEPTPVDNPYPGDWTVVSDARAYGGSYIRASSTSSNYATYSLAVPNGPYRTLTVMATWVPHEDNISNAVFYVYDYFGNPLASVSVDQTVAPGDYQDGTGRWWQVLSVQTTIPFNTTVYVSPQPGAQADAVRLVEVGPRAVKNGYDPADAVRLVEVGPTVKYAYDTIGKYYVHHRCTQQQNNL